MQSQRSQVDMVHSHRDRKTRTAVVRAWVTQEGREREQPPPHLHDDQQGSREWPRR